MEETLIGRYVCDPEYSIILCENPPFAETTSVEHQKIGKAKASSRWKDSFVIQEMKKDLQKRKRTKVEGKNVNDLGNAFIWSALKYYLRQPNDSYVVFSPAKYWKAQHLIDKKFIDGFAFNRRWFHANIDACIMCILWPNEDADIGEIKLKGFDIDPKADELTGECELAAKRINSMFSETYYDKRKPEPLEDGILCGLDGLPKFAGVKSETAAYDPERILGYMIAKSSGFDNPDLASSLLVGGKYDGHGFWLHKDNYLFKLPMFAASRYITYNRGWTERGMIMKSGDGAKKFESDVRDGKLIQFLLKCLLFTCLEMQNHMRTFTGPDGADTSTSFASI